jgi:hypothetical protein
VHLNPIATEPCVSQNAVTKNRPLRRHTELMISHVVPSGCREMNSAHFTSPSPGSSDKLYET